MNELTTLASQLDRLDKVINNDRNLTAKAFGILLLGKRFDRTDKKAVDPPNDEPEDPTKVLLSGRVKIPKL